MATIHIPESEAAADFAGLIARVMEGNEVVIDRGDQPVAVIRVPMPSGRRISDCISLLPERSQGIMDDAFAADVQEFIDSHREPVQAGDWD